MTPAMGHVVTLLCTAVAIAAAAPTAERANEGNQEQVPVSLSDGDRGIALDRAKQAKEEFVFGNQQNGARAPAFAAKKSMPLMGGVGSQPVSEAFQFPPPLLRPLEMPPGGVDPASEAAGFVRYSGDLFGFPAAAQGAGDRLDKSGYMYASQQMPVPVVPIQVQEETASELGEAAPPAAAAVAPMVPEKGGALVKEAENKPKEEQKTPAPSAVSKEVNGQPTAEVAKGTEPPPQQVPEGKETEEEAEEAPEQTPASAVPASVVVEPEVPAPQTSRLPQNSRAADAEEILHAQDQALEKDDVESFLGDLKEPQESHMTSYENGDNDDRHHQQGGKDAKEEEAEEEAVKEEEVKEEAVKEEEVKEEAAKEEAVKEEAEEEEGSTEAELIQVQNAAAAAGSAMQNAQPADPTAEVMDPAEEDYRKELLEYILLNGDEYGRVPISYPGGGYPQPYPPGSYGYLQRRRRSLATVAARGHGRRHTLRLPHIHSRGSSRAGKRHAAVGQLSRAKRTKRDLFDDELYYNPVAAAAAAEAAAVEAAARQYALERAVAEEEAEEAAEEEEEEEEEKQAEMVGLISYLMGLYANQPGRSPSSSPSSSRSSLWNLWGYPTGYSGDETRGYLDYPDIVEEARDDVEPDFVEVLPPPEIANWKPPILAAGGSSSVRQPVAPAWEPAFYPEEMEEALEEEEGEPGYYLPTVLPVKRGVLDYAGERLRKRHFLFPGYEQRDPYYATNWGAFVPAAPALEKRDYEEGYRRLRDLASVLADADARGAQQDSSLPEAYFDAFSDKRKK